MRSSERKHQREDRIKGKRRQETWFNVTMKKKIMKESDRRVAEAE